MKIAIIGAGAMGGSLAEGLLESPLFTSSDIVVANPHVDKLAPFAAKDARVTTSNTEAVSGADYVVIAVKPWVVERVISDIKPVLDYDRQTIICMAAAIPSSQLLAWLERQTIVPTLFLAIPNLAVACHESMTFISTPNATDGQIAGVEALFNSVGRTMLVDEAMLSAGTSIAGCGIAYAMRYIRAAIEGSVELGLRASDARQVVMQTVKGAVALLEHTGGHPEAEIDRVTTPGGLTIRGLNAMEDAGFTRAVIHGLTASNK